jgi:5,10-methenyltetrahydromethanopterin hydrogenase
VYRTAHHLTTAVPAHNAITIPGRSGAQLIPEESELGALMDSVFERLASADGRAAEAVRAEAGTIQCLFCVFITARMMSWISPVVTYRGCISQIIGTPSTVVDPQAPEEVFYCTCVATL